MRKVAFDDIELIKVTGTPEVEVAKTLGKGYYFTPLPYWHEETNYTWTKLDLSEGDNEIWVYYGSETATDESDGDSVFEFFDDFEGTELNASKWEDDNGVSVSGSILTIQGDTENNQKGLRTALSFPDEVTVRMMSQRTGSGDLDPTVWYNSSVPTSYSGYYNPDGHPELACWFTENSGLAGIYLSENKIVDSPVDYTSTNWTILEFRPTSGALFGRIGDDTFSGASAHSHDNQKFTFTINSHEGLAWKLDWVAVRKYSSSPPSISYSSEESGSWTIDGHTFTKRKKVTITSSQALSGYQVQLDYSQWNENNIRVLRKVWIG